MSRYRGITGAKYGRLTCLEYIGSNKYRRALWRCVCECGNETVVEAASLFSGNTKSCGCLRREAGTRSATIYNSQHRHGQVGTPIYHSWAKMKERCLSSNCPSYKDYGGRGIKICNEWLEFKPFYEWAIANGFKEGLTIERIDNNGNYEPGNCRWATMLEQANNKRSNRTITHNGQTKTVIQWSRELGVSASAIYQRIASGWPSDRLLIPVRS